MKPFKIFKAFLPAVLLCLTIVGCSGNQAKAPSELILGNWEYRNQTWCEFYDDSTCIIGGMAGEYKIKDDNSITLSVYGSDEPLSFEWASNEESVDFEHWYVTEDTLFINGMQYPKGEDTEKTSAATAVESAATEASDNSSN
ncbi:MULTISPECIES: hypothetical protein [unclassified Ruminococcus]|uniref:hypothetical protein n=1 Tax=unclassified Ruminococcus TaxID=2608920 RepID=UPI002108C04E|nr:MULTISPECIES: hypothetical protein [unclassified Ruminococcus]MCQ4022279.1 hypothetical protein [Ruminococcus sp. zg-924]MCQ4114607.1 hypothetical protein [Ruminococcus sp. zg-921]